MRRYNKKNFNLINIFFLAPISPPTNINLQSPQWHQVKVNWQSPSKSSWFCSNIKYRIEFTNGTQPKRQIEVLGYFNYFFN